MGRQVQKARVWRFSNLGWFRDLGVEGLAPGMIRVGAQGLGCRVQDAPEDSEDSQLEALGPKDGLSL